MKVQLNPVLEGLKGTIGNLVFADKKLQMVDDSIVQSYTWCRRYVGLNPSSSSQQFNIVILFRLITDYFNTLKADPTAYPTWVSEAMYYQGQLGRTVTVMQLFRSYYSQKFLSFFSPWATPAALSAGSSLSWADRETRTWSAI